MAKQPAFKDKQKALSMEDVMVDTNYAFTINPSDKYQKFNSYTRLSDFLKDSTHYLSTLCRYVLYPELSPKGRLHFHGWIWFNTTDEIVQFYLNYLPSIKDKCTYEMDYLTDIQVWTKYCLKQKVFHEYFTKQTFHQIPLQHDFGDVPTKSPLCGMINKRNK